jgi:hypothetical protein
MAISTTPRNKQPKLRDVIQQTVLTLLTYPQLVVRGRHHHGANDQCRPGHRQGNPWQRFLCRLWHEKPTMGERFVWQCLLP